MKRLLDVYYLREALTEVELDPTEEYVRQNNLWDVKETFMVLLDLPQISEYLFMLHSQHHKGGSKSGAKSGEEPKEDGLCSKLSTLFDLFDAGDKLSIALHTAESTSVRGSKPKYKNEDINKFKHWLVDFSIQMKELGKFTVVDKEFLPRAFSIIMKELAIIAAKKEYKAIHNRELRGKTKLRKILSYSLNVNNICNPCFKFCIKGDPTPYPYLENPFMVELDEIPAKDFVGSVKSELKKQWLHQISQNR